MPTREVVNHRMVDEKKYTFIKNRTSEDAETYTKLESELIEVEIETLALDLVQRFNHLPEEVKIRFIGHIYTAMKLITEKEDADSTNNTGTPI